MLPRPPRRPTPVLLLRGVTKTFRAGVPGCVASVRVLAGVDLVLWAGERVVVLGAPASGRTTLLLLAAGLLTPDSGELWRAPGAAAALPCAAGGPCATGTCGAGRCPPVAGALAHVAWVHPGRAPTALVVLADGAPLPDAPTRAYRLAGGRLHPVGAASAAASRAPGRVRADASAPRVDSVPHPP